MPHRLFTATLAAALGALALSAHAAAAAPLAVGFYLPWDAASQASLVAHAASLDVISPMSGALDSPTGSVRWQPDPSRAPALAAAHGKARVFPIVSNAHDEVWDSAAADSALTDPKAGDAFIANLVAQAKAQNLGGYVLDFENLTPKGTAAYAPFLARLRKALNPLGRELWVTALLSADPGMIRDLAAATDTVVLMAYDQCWATATPGPIAGNDWLAASLDARTADAGRGKFIVALGGYGYDWPKGKTAAVLSAAEAAALARTTGQAVARTAPDANPHFAYRAPDGTGHAVWYLDAATYRAQRTAALARGARGVALWRLGLEDPAIWSKAPAAAPKLSPGSPPPACVLLPRKP